MRVANLSDSCFGFQTKMNQLLVDLFFYGVLITGAISASEWRDQSELRLVTVIFRHGDRTPADNEMYPNDPYYNNSFYPEGLGQLTNNGKLRAYKLGQSLRKRYGEYLEDIYTPNVLEARSTNYDRTKMTLQLVLAGLYPPKGTQRWNDNLDWQPIPTSYVPKSEDWLLNPRHCPEYKEEKIKAGKLLELVGKVESYRAFMNKLTKLTGKKVTKPSDMYHLYHILTAETAMNLTLPDWTKNIFPRGKLFDGTVLTYDIYSYTTRMRRLNGGKYLHEIIDKMRKVRSGEMEKGKKLFLYSAHEDNLASVLASLNIYKPHIPDYSSAIITELREIRSEYYVQVYYYNGITRVFDLQKIPGCETSCLMDTFLDLLKDVTPSADELTCGISKTPEELGLIDNLIDRE